MKRFLAFVKKEFHHIFRDKRTLLILFGIPVAQILLFGYVISTEIKDVEIGIVDRAGDELSGKLVSKILSSGYFILSDDNPKSEANLESYFKKGKIREVIIIEPGFSEKLTREKSADIMLVADATDANTANLIVNYTTGIIMDFMKDLNGFNDNPNAIKTEVRMLYNSELQSVYMFVPGTMALILMLISAMMTSISIAREKEMGTMENMLVSPLKPAQIVIGKVTPYILLSFVNAVTIILLGALVFGVPVKGSIALLMAESILFIALSLSIGIMISTLSNSQQTAMFISMFALLLPTMLLSGFIFPVENMPILLQWFTHLIPPKYFIIIIKNIMLKGTGFIYVWKESLILLMMFFFFMIVSVKKFKVRLE